MTAKRIPLPPSLGGGDVVMRVLNVGEYEDLLKGLAAAKAVELQSALIQQSISAFRGKPVPRGLVEREAWWRGLSLPLREVLAGYYERLNSTLVKEVDDFFKAAETVPTSP